MRAMVSNLCSIWLSAYNLLISNNIFLLELYKENLQTTTFLFTQDWLNYYRLSSVSSCPFIALHKQYNERSLSMIVFSLSCFYIVVCSFAYLSIPFRFLFCWCIVYLYCIRLHCVLVIYLFRTYTDVVVGLLITSSMYVSV